MQYIFVTTVQAYDSEPLKSYSLFGRKIGISRSGAGSYYGLEINCKEHGADQISASISR